MLHLAAMKALMGEARGKLITHSLHSELVYNTSGSKHVRSPARCLPSSPLSPTHCPISSLQHLLGIQPHAHRLMAVALCSDIRDAQALGRRRGHATSASRAI